MNLAFRYCNAPTLNSVGFLVSNSEVNFLLQNLVGARLHIFQSMENTVRGLNIHDENHILFSEQLVANISLEGPFKQQLIYLNLQCFSLFLRVVLRTFIRNRDYIRNISVKIRGH